MNHKPYLSFSALLLSIMVLYAHTSIVLHDVDHAFHTHTKVCDTYIFAQHNADSSLISQPVTTLLAVYPSIISHPFYQVVSAVTPSSVKIRAPPIT